MSIVNPEIDVLLNQVDSKFTLCTLSAKRSRQINDMIHGVRGQALGAMSTSEIAKLTSAKPLALAMDEIATGDVSHVAPLETPEDMAPLGEEAEKDALPLMEEEAAAAEAATAAETAAAAAAEAAVEPEKDAEVMLG